jgi:hypothetical protein
MAIFWVIALMMEAVRTSETLVNFYQTTRRYNPEDSHLRLEECPAIWVTVTVSAAERWERNVAGC